MKIDIFNHVMTPRYLELMKQHMKDAGIVKRMTSIRMLWDMDARVQMLEQWPDVQQVLTLSLPGPEMVGGPELSPELARIANDELAAICAKMPSVPCPCSVTLHITETMPVGSRRNVAPSCAEMRAPPTP